MKDLPLPKDLSSENGPTPGALRLIADIRTTLRWLAVATAVLYVVLIVGLVWVWTSARSTEDALCTFREDSQQRLTATRDILDKNPAAFDKLGVPQPVITQNLRNQQRTIDALKSLDC